MAVERTPMPEWVREVVVWCRCEIDLVNRKLADPSPDELEREAEDPR